MWATWALLHSILYLQLERGHWQISKRTQLCSSKTCFTKSDGRMHWAVDNCLSISILNYWLPYIYSYISSYFCFMTINIMFFWTNPKYGLYNISWSAPSWSLDHFFSWIQPFMALRLYFSVFLLFVFAGFAFVLFIFNTHKSFIRVDR